MALLMSLAIPKNRKAHDILKPKREERTYSLVSQHGLENHMEAWIESNSFLYVSSDSEHLVNMRCDEQKIRYACPTTGIAIGLQDPQSQVMRKKLFEDSGSSILKGMQFSKKIGVFFHIHLVTNRQNMVI